MMNNLKIKTKNQTGTLKMRVSRLNTIKIWKKSTIKTKINNGINKIRKKKKKKWSNNNINNKVFK